MGQAAATGKFLGRNATVAELSAAGRGRLTIVDIARGVAIVAMVAYHAIWDLGPDFYAFIEVNAAEDPALKTAARAIAGSFLFLAGVSLVLAHGEGFRPRPFLRRLAIIVAAALLVTIVTRIAMPETFVRFGILHSIAAASVIGGAFLRLHPFVVLGGAAAAFAAPALFAADAFNAEAWLWLGLATEVPAMVDYVPLLPWVGATLLGIGATKLALSLGLGQRLSRRPPGTRLGRSLVWAGRWSLVIYLIHQPILFGLIYLIAIASGQPTPELL